MKAFVYTFSTFFLKKHSIWVPVSKLPSVDIPSRPPKLHLVENQILL